MVVSFPSRGTAIYKASDLEVVKDSTPIAHLKAGEIFGEVSVLYGIKYLATFRAAAGRDVALFGLGRSELKECLVQLGARAENEEWCKLLDEVSMLSGMFDSERKDLARNATGQHEFAPGKLILKEGKSRNNPQWYIVCRGSAVVSQSGGHLRELHRGDHFGGECLMQGEGHSQVTVHAGQQGLVCLLIDGDTLKSVGVHFDEDELDLGNLCSEKPSGWQERYKVDPHKLESVKELGQGAFGKVILQQDPVTKQRYALKQISKRSIIRQGLQLQIRNERNLHAMVNSPFVVGLQNSYRDRCFVYMLIEAAEGGSLEDLLEFRSKKKQAVSYAEWSEAVMFYSACIVEGLRHLHARKIAHRDLKPGNILVSKGYAKLCDLGFARFVINRTYTLCGTPEYMAPELLDFPHEHDLCVDWWALGATIFELLSGQTPWDGGDELGNRFAVIRNGQRSRPFPGVDLPAETLPSARAFLVELLTPSKDKRLGGAGGADQVCKHRWFEEATFDFGALRNQCMEAPDSLLKRSKRASVAWAKRGSSMKFASTHDLKAEVESHNLIQESTAASESHSNHNLEQDEDEEVAPGPDQFDIDDNFCRIAADEYLCQDVEIFDGEDFSQVQKVGGTAKRFDGIATSKQKNAVRITFKSLQATGMVKFGLTTNSMDDQNFHNGFWVAIAPTKPDDKGRAQGNGYLAGPRSSVTLALENGEVLVIRNGQRAHSFGFSPCEGMFAKLFFSDLDDKAAITSYREFEDDEKGWDAVFE